MGRVLVPNGSEYVIREQFDDIGDSQVPQLTYVLSEVAEIILGAFNPQTIDSVRCCHTDIKKSLGAIEFRKKI